MCGIAGLWSPQDEGQAPLEGILKQQQARGPDAQGTARLQTRNGALHLGSNRLAVIDLSPAANMPFWCNEGKSCLTYNGEIYNYLELRQDLEAAGYAFRGKSDTEVLLAALLTWGTQSLERLNGMFAFALWNEKQQVLWLGRDRFGEKPLCYYLANQGSGHFAFASNPVALARLYGLSPDLNYVARGLRFLIYEDDSPMTAFCGLQALPPGHWAEVSFTADGPRLRASRYYSLPDEVERTAHTCLRWTPTQAVERVSALLDDSVRLRLRTDVPMGLSLSGGIDSTLVALLSERHCQPLRCFSYARPDGGTSEGDATEGPQIRTWAAQHQHEVKFVWPDGQAFLEGYQRCLDCQQGPFPGLSVVAQNCIYYDVRQSGVKVMLGGQGADEAFLGYRKFLGFGLQEALRQGDIAVILSLLKGLVSTVFSEVSTWQTLLAMRSRYLSRGGLATGLRGMPASTWDLHSMDQGLRHRHILDLLRFSLPTLLRYETVTLWGTVWRVDCHFSTTVSSSSPVPCPSPFNCAGVTSNGLCGPFWLNSTRARAPGCAANATSMCERRLKYCPCSIG